LSQERVLKTLMELGLSETDAQVYVYLATKGPQIARNITNELKMYKRKTYRSLKNLRNKGIVSASPKRPAQFSAVPFEKIFDLSKNAKLEEAQRIEQNKEEILSYWRSMITGNSAS
jgi:sugar-specific transcriptional regulator TrmB